MSKMPINLRRELGIVLIAICISAIVLPALIYIVGSQIFGAYGGGITGMYYATLQDVATLRPAAWIIVFGPALCIVLLRMVLRLTEVEPPSPPTPSRARREPTLNT